MKRVVIESPFAADKSKMPTPLLEKGEQSVWCELQVQKNLQYLRAAMHDCLVHHKEAPFASHGLYTQPGVLDDDIPKERELGIQAGFAFREVAELSVFYVDLGMSKGMQFGLDHANQHARPVEYRAFLHGFEEGQASTTLKVQHLSGLWFVSAPKPDDLVVSESLEGAVRSVSRLVRPL